METEAVTQSESKGWQKHRQTCIKTKIHKCRYSYIEVRDMVLQQDLNIANTLLSAHKGEGDHSLCRQHKTTHNTHVNKGLT